MDGTTMHKSFLMDVTMMKFHDLVECVECNPSLQDMQLHYLQSL